MIESVISKAGSFLLERTNRNAIQKEESDFVTSVDFRVHDFLHEELPRIIPGSVVISEEDKIEKHVSNGYVWIVDPVDGTSNIVYDLHHSCVSIALLNNGEVVEGAIYNPYLNEMFTAQKGKGSFLNGKPIQVDNSRNLENSFIGFEAGPASKHSSFNVIHAIEYCYQHANGIRILGSSAIDLAYVACGRFSAAYFDYLYPWDYAAGKLIIEEAGGKFTAFDGSEPTFFSKDAFVASNGFFHDDFIQKLNESRKLGGIVI